MKSFFAVLLGALLCAGPSFADQVVKVDKPAFTLTLYEEGVELGQWSVALGKNLGQKQRRGDCRTPQGVFRLVSRQDASKWWHDFGDGKGPIPGAYGPLFLRLQTPPFKGIGIHGTHDPSSIGTRATEGCIRMKNEDLLAFASLVRDGASVVISDEEGRFVQ